MVQTPTTPYSGRSWIRRTHAVLGLISACNLLILVCTGLLLQHATLFRLDERAITRRLLPSGYRPQDGEREVRADIVVADLHSGRLFGTVGRLVLDAATFAWLIMLTTGLVMYSLARRRNRRPADTDIASERECTPVPVEGKRQQ
jgi:hypothetical protein